MSGKDWTPHNFSGTFDGQGHKIYNIVVERSDNTPSSFIWALTGVLKNVIIGSYDGVSKDGTSHFYQLRSDNSDYRFAGLVNNTSGAASLSNVKNFADVKVLSSSTAIRLYRVAGICAQWSSTGNVIDCENYGDITAESEVPAKENNGTIAGIISFVNTDITVSGCKNYGTVTSNNSQVAFLSGIVGNANGGSALQVSSCMNYGKILSTATPTGFNAINLGGIVAQFSKTGSIVKDSDNHGEILHEISSQTSNTNNLGGIVAYMIYGTVDNCDNYSPVTAKLSDSYSGSETYKFNSNTNVGGIVGYANTNDCLVKDCNNMTGGVVSNLADNNQCMLGGIVGKINIGATNVTDCNNYAAVTNTGRLNYCYFGGIVGRYDGPGKVSGCTNSGVVSTSGITSTDKGLRIGGIVGASNKAITVSSCTNTGDVVNTGAMSVNHGIGGIFGHPTGGNAKVLDCKFNASVSDSASGGQFLGAVVGMLPTDIEISNTGVRGTVGTVPLTEDNYSSYLLTMNGSCTVKTTTPNYYWDGE